METGHVWVWECGEWRGIWGMERDGVGGERRRVEDWGVLFCFKPVKNETFFPYFMYFDLLIPNLKSKIFSQHCFLSHMEKTENIGIKLPVNPWILGVPMWNRVYLVKETNSLRIWERIPSNSITAKVGQIILTPDLDLEGQYIWN